MNLEEKEEEEAKKKWQTDTNVLHTAYQQRSTYCTYRNSSNNGILEYMRAIDYLLLHSSSSCRKIWKTTRTPHSDLT